MIVQHPQPVKYAELGPRIPVGTALPIMVQESGWRSTNHVPLPELISGQNVLEPPGCTPELQQRTEPQVKEDFLHALKVNTAKKIHDNSNLENGKWLEFSVHGSYQGAHHSYQLPREQPSPTT